VSTDLITISGLLFFSAFFSGSESALFSLQWWHLHRLQSKRNPLAIYLVAILKNPHRILAAILLGNTLVNVAASSIAERYLEEAFPGQGLWISIAGMTILLLVLGEITPKTLAVYHAERVATWVVVPVDFAAKLFWPVRIVLEKISRLSSRLVVRDERIDSGRERAEFLDILSDAEHQGILSPSEQLVARKILEMEEISVSQIMIPRTDMVSLPETVGYDEAIRKMEEMNLRRIPLYRGTVDRIVGILYAKDLLASRFDAHKRKNPRILARPPYFVPGSIKLKQLYSTLKQKRLHLAVVLDEYGGTAGLVSHEDLLLTLLEPVAQQQSIPSSQITATNEGYMISGRARLDSLAKQNILDITESGFRTLNGYLMDRFGCIPPVGTWLSLSRGSIQIMKTKARAIDQVHFIPAITPKEESS
jgi:magnesium and cobalt exporter, CNNM family